jgi:ferredoxin
MTGYRARVDDQVCVGTSMCQSVAPRAFSLNPEGQASYVPDSDTPLEELLEAAENCPVQAITVDKDPGSPA